MRILVVDDERVIRDLCNRALARAGHEVRVASGIGEASGAVEGFEPEIVLTDLRLGDLDGLAVIRLVRERSPHARTVVMTGSDLPPEELSRVRAVHIDALIHKPFSIEELKEAVGVEAE